MIPREFKQQNSSPLRQSLSKARMIQQHLSRLLLAMHCGHVQRGLAAPASAVLVIGWHLHGLVDGSEVLRIQQKGQDLQGFPRRDARSRKSRTLGRAGKPTRANGGMLQIFCCQQRMVSS